MSHRDRLSRHLSPLTPLLLPILLHYITLTTLPALFPLTCLPLIRQGTSFGSLLGSLNLFLFLLLQCLLGLLVQLPLHHMLLPHCHDVPHLLHDFALHVLIGLFGVDLVEGALLADVLATLELEELGRLTTFASIG